MVPTRNRQPLPYYFGLPAICTAGVKADGGQPWYTNATLFAYAWGKSCLLLSSAKCNSTDCGPFPPSLSVASAVQMLGVVGMLTVWAFGQLCGSLNKGGCCSCRDLQVMEAPLFDLEIRGVPALQYFGEQVWR